MSTLDLPFNLHDGATATSDLPFNLQGSLTKLEEEKPKVKAAKTKLEEAKRIVERGNWQSENGQPLNPIPKIQKVQPYLRKRPEFAKYYSPKLVSIGPIHRRDEDSQENLKAGKHYKLMWAAMYLEAINQTAQQQFEKIQNKLSALKGLYTEDAIEGYHDEELAWIFLLDGCALLYFMDKASVNRPQDLTIKVDQLILVQEDLLLLENQLPYQLLKLLSNEDVYKLDVYIKNFFQLNHMIGEKYHTSTVQSSKSTIITVDNPTHLLDHLRRAILGSQKNEGPKTADNQMFPTYRNIQELKAAGISVVKGKKDASLTAINFNRFGRWCLGGLELSKLIVDDYTLPTFLNLIAYEMCPDFLNDYEISSYVAFLDSLIDHADDVKELRKAGVLHNALGSDEDVAKLFNTISTDLVPDTERYRDVRIEIERRYNTKWLTWLAQALHDHFNTPWTFLGFAAAFIALFLTFVQTWLTIYPSCKCKD